MIRKEEDDFDVHSELNSYVTSVIFSTSAFLEACINEFFCDISDASAFCFKVTKAQEKLIQEMWRTGIPRTASYSILDKYQTALSFLGQNQLDKSKSPVQDIVEIVRLRNALIHYEPEWRDWKKPEEAQDKFFKKLRGKFETNTLFESYEPYFPNLCLGSGCAKWAVEKALEFTDIFYISINQEPNYRHIRETAFPWKN